MHYIKYGTRRNKGRRRMKVTIFSASLKPHSIENPIYIYIYKRALAPKALEEQNRRACHGKLERGHARECLLVTAS